MLHSQTVHEIGGASTTCGRQTRRTYVFPATGAPAYDAYGNNTREDLYGDSNDDATISRSYTANTTAWIVGLPTIETTYSGAGATVLDSNNMVAEQKFFYDGATDCLTESANTSPTLGNLTQTVSTL
ncbi:MAG TPA: hypothetical protein VHM25_26325, partial [Polyangiaceae bacterium]|nr:hypothetical protein [Polyangiaceae bacterium]